MEKLFPFKVKSKLKKKKSNRQCADFVLLLELETSSNIECDS